MRITKTYVCVCVIVNVGGGWRGGVTESISYCRGEGGAGEVDASVSGLLLKRKMDQITV